MTELPTLEPDQKGNLLSESEIDAQWKRFQAAVRPSRRRWLTGTLAAVLLVGLVGFATWTTRLNQQPAESRFMASANLVPVFRPRGEHVVELQKVRWPGWAQEMSLNLDLAGVETHPKYRLRIETWDGGHVLDLANAPSNSNGTIDVGVPRNLLPVGAYRIRLFGPGGTEVAIYEFQIEP
jgi:hypothetical protein